MRKIAARATIASLVILLFIGLAVTFLWLVWPAGAQPRYSYGPWSRGFLLQDPDADRYAMWDDSEGAMAWSAGTEGSDEWGDPVDADIVPAADDTYDLGASATQFKDGYFDGTLEADVLTEGGTAVASVSELSAALIDGGAGALDGDKLEITATWDNITADTTIAEADSVDDLAAILEGIDDAIGNVGTIDTSTVYAAAWNADANAPSMNLIYDYLVQMDSDADGYVEPYNISSSDLTLSTEGEMGLKSHEDGVAYHSGSSGEVSGEVFKSHLDYLHVAFDPGAQYDSNSVVCIANLDAKVFPNGVIIDYWEVDCMLDPDVEMNMNLGYANNYDDVGDPNLIDVLDTTTGQASEDTDANINGGAAVPAGSIVFLYFDADPEGTCTQLNVDIIWHREED